MTPKQPQEESKAEEESVTTKERPETWDMEKMRLFQKSPIQEQMQVLKDLIDKPEETQNFLALLQQYAEEKEKENQRIIEDFKETTKIEEESLGMKEEPGELEISITRVSTGVLNFRACLYRDQFQFSGPC